MSDHSSPESSHDVGIKVEPDDVPTGMLTKLAVAVTIVVVISVVGVNMLFDKAVGDELNAKGYDSVEAVSADRGSAKTW